MTEDPACGEARSPWPSQVHRDLVEELLRMRRRRSQVDPGTKLESSAFAILWILSDGRPRTLRELSEALELEQSTVNRQVNAAIKHGYLERFEQPGNVSRLVRPTALGTETFEHDGLRRAERLNRVFEDLAPGSPEALLRELRAFNDAYDRVSHRSTQPAK